MRERERKISKWRRRSIYNAHEICNDDEKISSEYIHVYKAQASELQANKFTLSDVLIASDSESELANEKNM